jgi:hypothetical protein
MKISNSFWCQNCRYYNDSHPIGTKQRNHCSQCLYSLHLDKAIPGDRLSECKALMIPVALYSKKNNNKYINNQSSIGEIKIIHQCSQCESISSNRIAGDDNESAILDLLEDRTDDELGQLKGYNILNKNSYQMVLKQLKGS